MEQATQTSFPVISWNRLYLRSSPPVAGEYGSKLHIFSSQQLERSGWTCAGRQQQLEDTGTSCIHLLPSNWREVVGSAQIVSSSWRILEPYLQLLSTANGELSISLLRNVLVDFLRYICRFW